MASPDNKSEDFSQRSQSHDQGTETEPTRPYIYTPLLSEYPARVICPNCHAQVLTRCKSYSGLLTWVFE